MSRLRAANSMTASTYSRSRPSNHSIISSMLVAVDGDPLADINVAINNVRWVMKAGGVVVDKTKGQVR